MTNGEKFKEMFSVTQVDDCDLNVYARGEQSPHTKGDYEVSK